MIKNFIKDFINAFIDLIKKDIFAIKRFFIYLFKVTNPIIDYPVIILAVLYLVIITLCLIFEMHFLELNIPILDKYRLTGRSLSGLVIFILYFLPICSLLVCHFRNDISLLTMKEGDSDPITRFLCIVSSIGGLVIFVCVVSVDLKYYIVLFIKVHFFEASFENGGT